MIFNRLSKLFSSLKRTRQSFSFIMRNIPYGQISQEKLDEFEALLLEADIGLETTTKIIDWMKGQSFHHNFKTKLMTYLCELLENSQMKEDLWKKTPSVTIVVGVNGTGKTTSVAKLSYYLKGKGKPVLMIAADTYRSAAIEQLQKWSIQANIPLIYNKSTRDPSSVMFDGLKASLAKDIDYTVVDTAGRLHTYHNLMNEINKMHRIIKNHFLEFKVLTLLVLDANLGQNSIIQAKRFNEYTPVDGVILTKMDGTAKGGIVFPVSQDLGIPILFLGVGETLEDFIEFNAKHFISSLLGSEKEIVD